MENNKINIAELLKDCPSGMKLNCTIYENVEFDLIDKTPGVTYPIHCLITTNKGYESVIFTEYGCVDRHPNAKCVIFPENKDTWEGFIPPCNFEDGDIVYFKTMHNNVYIAIFKINKVDYLETYIKFYINDFGVISSSFDLDSPVYLDDIKEQRLATEEEKQKLFQAIKVNGYKWNEESKTVEDLNIPKFKVGDRIKTNKYEYIIVEIKDGYYLTKGGSKILIKNQDYFKLVPDNKFDISTLVPFESRVLVRDSKNQIWKPAIFGAYIINKFYYITVGGLSYKQLIPYKDNEDLMGTINDCKEYFKTWKE